MAIFSLKEPVDLVTSHHLRAKIQLHAIYVKKQIVRNDIGRLLIVVDLNNSIL